MSYWGNSIFQFDPRAEEEKKEIRSAANRCGIILILMLAVMYAVSFGLSALVAVFRGQLLQISKDTVLWNAIFSLGMNLLIYAVLVPILMLICNSSSGVKAADYLRLPELPGREMGKLLIMGLGVVYTASYTGNILYNAANMLLQQLFGITMQSPDITVERNPVSIAVLIVGTAILAPFFEELLVRCGLVGILRKYGCWFTAITTGVLFGFMHTSFQQVFFAMMMGIYAGFVAYRTRSVWPTILLHIIVNSISVIQVILLSFTDLEQIEYLLNNFQSMDSQQFLLELRGIMDSILPLAGVELIGLGVLVLGIVGIVKLCREIGRRPREFNPREGGSLLRLPEKLKAFFTAPSVLVFFTLSILLSLYNAFPIG